MTRILLALCLAVVLPQALRAGTVDDALTRMADDIQKYAKANNIGEIRLEGFHGVGQFSTSGGPFLVNTLTRLLKERNLEVKAKAPLTLVGEYEEVEDKETAVQAV